MRKLTHELFQKIEARASAGEQTKDICQELSINPHHVYAWRQRMKRKGPRQVIVHHASGTAEQAKRTSAKTKTPQGYLVFGTPEFLKQFVELS